MFGFVLGLSVVRRYNLIKTQFWGFVLSAAGLAVTIFFIQYLRAQPAGDDSPAKQYRHRHYQYQSAAAPIQ